MPTKRSVPWIGLALLILLPQNSSAITEPKTKTEYPDEVVELVDGTEYKLVVTGVSVREKTFMKVDVYTIASYVDAGTALDPGKKGADLVVLKAPKRIQMDIRRNFSRDKLAKSFTDIIERNFDDQSAFSADLETFLGYFDREAQDGDVLVFDYHPSTGVTTLLNDGVKGTIENPAFAEALWTVWFGEKPASGGMKEQLLGLE